MRKISEIEVKPCPADEQKDNCIDDYKEELEQLIIDNIKEIDKKIVSLEYLEIKQNSAKSEEEWNILQRAKESQREVNQESLAQKKILKEIFEIKTEEIV